MNNTLEIKAGQTWGDLKEGSTDKYWRVDSISETHAECAGVQTGKKVSMRKDRLKPGSQRYYLAMDNDVIQEVTRLLEPSKEQQATATTITEPKPETKLEPVKEAAVQPTTEPKPKVKKKSKSAKAEPSTTA
jgi:cell division protein FtsN